MRRRFLVALLFACVPAWIAAQIPGRNVNMVSGRTWPEGDPFLQRQNEPSVAASTRNPLHLLAGANDYRTVDLPGLPDDAETGDAWMGLFKSADGGNTWRSNLLPGYPQDTSFDGMHSPLKGYTAAADPVVRAGTNGLFFYSGIVFDRPPAAQRSALFVARYVDNNNKESGDPILYAGATLVATNPGTAFIDKPWFAVDVPRTGAQTCSITTTQANGSASGPGATITRTQQFSGGAAYVAYSLISGEGSATRSQLYFSRSLDCGLTWSASQQISSPVDPINQGATLAIDPRNGTIYIAWRRFSADGTDDSIMVSRSFDQGRKWDPPGRARRFPRGRKVGLQQELHGKNFKPPTELADLTSLDQPTGEDRFRSNAYPSMTVDAQGRVYVAWAERGYAPLRPDLDDGDARVLIATSANGTDWTAPAAVDNGMQAGHQLMPALTFAGGKLMVAYYDLREDEAGVFSKFVDEFNALFIDTTSGPVPRAPRRRHTVDVRAAQAAPAAVPSFAPSVKVSEYLVGSRANSLTVEQLQFNPPNLKLFRQGHVPFIGDYIDLAPSPAFVPAVGGGWVFNTAPSSSPLFHAVWADNRDVIPPPDGNWANYTPPNYPAGETRPDLGHGFASCVADRAGMRNQNVYTTRITGGLVAGSPGNTKTLASTLQRAFVIYAQNATEQTRTFAVTITNQPVGGRASFDPFPLPPYTPSSPAPRTTLQVSIPRRSTVARTLYATSTDPHATINVSITEVSGIGGGTVQDGLSSAVILNPDISNPDISNPDISNPDISNPDISNTEVHNPDISNPDISNPDISNPDISNPDISNPDISNPDISNVVVANPDISNPDISNPDISNPDISNPDISNPDISNPDISNQSLTDTTWTLTNEGNTTTAYSVKLLLNGTTQVPAGIVVQLVLRKIYQTPALLGCDVVNQRNNILLANILNPRFTPASDVGNPDTNNPDISNPTLWLAPGETARLTLRVLDPDIHDAITFVPAEQVTPAVVSQAINTSTVISFPPDRPVALPPALNVGFDPAPSGGFVGANIGPVRVLVRDDHDAPLPGVSATLSAEVLSGTGALAGAPLVATTDAAGRATFNPVVFTAAGTYRLHVRSQMRGFVPVDVTADITIAVPVPTTFVVTTIADSGPGSLRSAIVAANANAPAADTIAFNIAGSGPFVIALSSPLPAIADAVAIDGTSQPGFSAETVVPVVDIVGANAGPADGITIAANGSSVRALAIDHFSGAGVAITGSDNTVDANRITSNGGAGVTVAGTRALRNRITSNVISGNGASAIDLGGDGATPNDLDDVDSGANALQNTPDIQAAAVNGFAAKTYVALTLNAAPGEYRIQLFENATCGTTTGEGQHLLLDTSIAVPAGGTYADTLEAAAVKPGVFLAATATDASGNTSEFSACALASTTNAFLWSTASGGNGHLYEYVLEPTAWTTASRLAASRSALGTAGYLTSIASGPENAFVNSLYTRMGIADLRAWIGLADARGDGVWQWGTGEPFGFANWAPGEPNNVGVERWVEIFASGGWNNNTDSNVFTQGYVVEYEPAKGVIIGSVTDPAGDAGVGNPDMISAAVLRRGGELLLQVRFAPGTFDPSTTVAQFMLDTDRDPATGHPGVNAGCQTDANVIGSEYLVNAQTSAAPVFKYAGTCNQFTFVTSAAATAVGNGYDIAIRLSSIQSTAGQLNFKLTTSRELPTGGFTGVLDVMPDVGLPAGTTGGS